MKFIPNFEEYLSEQFTKNIDENRWFKLVRESIWHRTAVKERNNLNKILNENDNSFPLLSALIRSIFFPENEDSQKILMHNFSSYVHSNYPNISFLNNIKDWSGMTSNKTIKSIISWYNQIIFNNESVICYECSMLMIPSFVKSGRYCCSNNDCSLFSIPIYESHCWSCGEDVSSFNCNECGNCEWVICGKCSSCRDKRYGGVCDKQFPVDSKIIRPIYSYTLKSETEKDKFFDSKLLDKIYKNSIKSYRYVPSKNMGNHNCNRGTKIIDKDQELDNYLALYLPMHVAKLFRLFENMDIHKVLNKRINIYDWGCGQGVATLSFIEYAKIHSIDLKIKSLYLIEPSVLAIQKAKSYIEKTECFSKKKFSVNMVNKQLNEIATSEIVASDEFGIHLFSNILDINGFDKKHIKNIVCHANQKKMVLITSPNYNDSRNNIDMFVDTFDNKFNMIYQNTDDLAVYCKDFRSKKNRNRRVTNYSKIFQLN